MRVRFLALLAAAGLVAAVAVAIAPALAASTRDLEKKLDAAIAAKDGAAAAAAIADLGAAGDEAAAKAIVAAAVAAAGTLDLEEPATAALSGMKGEAARAYLFKAVKSEKNWVARFLVVAALARTGTPEAEDAVIEALEDREPTVGAAAVSHLERRATRETVGKLVRALPRLDREKRLAPVRKAVAGALRDLTGLDVDDTQDWTNWWAANGAAFEPKKLGAAGESGGDVVTRLRENHPSDFRTVERLSPDDILLFHGKTDRIERVLESLKLPFRALDRERLMDTPLDPARQVVVFACNGTRDRFSDEEVKKVRDFVAAGGYLFTGDIVLKSLTERAFPGQISFAGETPPEKWTVKIRPAAAGMTHPYARDVFPLDPFQRENFTWKIHEQTYLMKLGEGVVPLVESEELAGMLAGHKGGGAKGGRGGKKGPAAQGPVPVAVTFRYGGERVETGKATAGAVLHVLSHFQDQQTKEGDGFALQQLLLNFIVEKQKARAHAP
jgi:hypothetical protein